MKGTPLACSTKYDRMSYSDAVKTAQKEKDSE